MSVTCPTFLTKNRLGIYLFQIRIPRYLRANAPYSRPIIQRSLGPRDSHEALRLARKMVVDLEENNFDVEKIEQEAQRDAELWHVGKPLFEKRGCKNFCLNGH